MSSSEFELNQAQYELDEIKSNLKEFLSDSYKTQQEADNIFKFLENVVNKVCKQQEFEFSFGSGGSPSWHVEVFKSLSRWIESENQIGILLSERILPL